MRLARRWGRMCVAGAVAASVALTVAAGPSTAATAGTTISVTPQPSGWHGVSSGGAAVDYWMSASNGAPVQASGAVFLPPGPAPAGGWPIMAFDHGTSGLGPGCGGMSDPTAQPPSPGAADENRLIQYFVSKGFAVAAPDYLGLGGYANGPHPYLELRSEATATIDLVRAARSTYPQLSRSWAVFGPSQGGQAALGTASVQRSYAPDLDFRGTIAVDPESDLEHVLPIAGPWVGDIPGVSGPYTTAFIAMTLAGLRATHPELNVDSYLSPQGRQVLDSISTLCLVPIAQRMQGLTIGSLLSRQLSDPKFTATLASYMGVPTSGYDAPILLLVNSKDTTVPAPLHATIAAQFAAHGVDFKPVVGHGKHTELNPQMWAAMNAFVAHILSIPTKP